MPLQIQVLGARQVSDLLSSDLPVEAIEVVLLLGLTVGAVEIEGLGSRRGGLWLWHHKPVRQFPSATLLPPPAGRWLHRLAWLSLWSLHWHACCWPQQTHAGLAALQPALLGATLPKSCVMGANEWRQ